MKFRARLAGCDVKDDESHSTMQNQASDMSAKANPKFKGCVWGKPETYKHLTKPELTEWSDLLQGYMQGQDDITF